METCIRGFSNTFLPDHKVDVIPLQYVEQNELERTWKVNRRERFKQQEERIWDEFVREKDVIKSICSDDPYQFLEHLPPETLTELMDAEIGRKRSRDQKKDASKDKEVPGSAPPQQDNQQTFTFTEIDQGDQTDQDSEVFQIYEDRDNLSEAEDLESLGTPCTVRERDEENEQPEQREHEAPVTRKEGVSPNFTRFPDYQPPDSPPAPQAITKSTENVANIIESSIYCAKVRDLRLKLVEEINGIMRTLECLKLMNLDSSEIRKLFKRAAEYGSRFQRIYLYQLRRIISDIKRHAAQALPYAKHTQFQSQMVRVVNLHQNMLQSFQAFHKSIEQTYCLKEASEQLLALSQSARDARDACAAVAPPQNLIAANDLYNDELPELCNKLDTAVRNYTQRAILLCDLDQKTSKKTGSRKSKNILPMPSASKSILRAGSKMDTNSKLSMYSFEKLCYGKGNIATSKYLGISESKDSSINKKKKSPGAVKRPLMRAPTPTGKARRRGVRENDIRTLVEQVAHVSQNVSPQRSRASPHSRSPESTARTTRTNTPRTVNKSNLEKPSDKPPPNRSRGSAVSSTRRSANKSGKRQTSEAPQKTTAKGSESPIPPISLHDRSFEDEKGQHHAIVDRVDITSPKTQVENFPPLKSPEISPQGDKKSDRTQPPHANTVSELEVTKLLRQLCGGDIPNPTFANKLNDRTSTAKNAQLLFVNGSSPRQTNTPQLLRILEETIQKKVPPSPAHKKGKSRDVEQLRLAFNIPQPIADSLFKYRTKFIQHMLTSALYANSAVGKPWEMIGSVSEQIIDEILLKVTQEMQIGDVVRSLYNSETKVQN